MSHCLYKSVIKKCFPHWSGKYNKVSEVIEKKMYSRFQNIHSHSIFCHINLKNYFSGKLLCIKPSKKCSYMPLQWLYYNLRLIGAIAT